MKKNKLIVCESFKYKDFLFRNYTKDMFKAGSVYKLSIDENDELYIDFNINETSHSIFLQHLGKEVKDPRFIGTFSELTLEWMVNNYIPIFDNCDELEEWIDGVSSKIEKYNDEEIEAEQEYEEDLIADIYSRLREFTPKLSTGILEALTGVESILPGELMDDEKEKLTEALKGCISNYLINGNREELFMAQYLLFNIINLAKNKW